MRSRLADDLAAERRAEEASMTPAERIRLALRLGDEAVELYRQIHPGTSRAEARRILARERQAGRPRPSKVKAP